MPVSQLVDDTPFCCTNRRTVRKLNGKSGNSGMFQWRLSGVILARVTEICCTYFKWEIWQQRYVSAAFQGQDFSARNRDLSHRF